ncbi:hypothetical protein BQ8794_50713 [Mesorhizobium prunaredense]|uniref:Pvc16 N-terminal domain-containing protein n=1 Tax=Mesorhizobium prunaredense TaxID=1631249 RepID=A0A1R3VJJ9_9HYPH|nr:DUF4255 domain-containing protein [Mesorhizobium prunaredense]SIT58611.1 hypothetical protein BQ8794_50713 [Mesorhizobium prunaredense]
MADASGIGFVSQSLQNLLRSVITDAGPFVGTQIDLRSPKELRLAGVQQAVVSLWLYRASRVEDLVNAPPVRIPPNRLVQRPLPLNLTYLVTPLAKDTLTEQRLLGLAMQAMHDNALLGADFLVPQLVDSGTRTLSVHLEPHSLEELTRIWHALQEPYELSAAYVVQYVPIVSHRDVIDGAPVLVKTDRYAAIGAVS